MINVGGYQNAVNSYYDNQIARPLRTKEESKIQSKDNDTKTSSAESGLSAKAKEFLNKLRENNDDMEFFVADSDEDMENALSKSNSEFSVAFSSEELEKMADDDDYANQMLNQAREAIDVANDISEQYDFEGKGIMAKLGISFNDDGTLNIFAELEKLSDKQKERQEAEKEAGKEDEAQRPQAKRPPMEAGGFSAYAKPEAVKRTTLTASTQDELIEQIQNLDWDAINKEEPVHAGMRFDSAV